jgi:hypothetical protein
MDNNPSRNDPIRPTIHRMPWACCKCSTLYDGGGAVEGRERERERERERDVDEKQQAGRHDTTRSLFIPLLFFLPRPSLSMTLSCH